MALIPGVDLGPAWPIPTAQAPVTLGAQYSLPEPAAGLPNVTLPSNPSPLTVVDPTLRPLASRKEAKSDAAGTAATVVVPPLTKSKAG